MRRYSKGQKNNFRDGEAIAEAVQRPTMKIRGDESRRVWHCRVGRRNGVDRLLGAVPLCKQGLSEQEMPVWYRSRIQEGCRGAIMELDHQVLES